MSLAKTADELGYTVRKQGKTLGGPRCPECGSGTDQSNRFCIFRGRDRKERWKCMACSAGGDIVDFIVSATGCTTAEAFARTRNGVKFNPSEAKEQCVESPSWKPGSAMTSTHVRALREGLSREPDDKVFAYLRGRALSRSTIEVMVEADQLRFLPSDVHHARKQLYEALGGVEAAESCGLLVAPKKWPAAAFRPIVGIMPGDCAVEFRMIEQSDTFKKTLRFGETQYPFFIRGTKEAKVVEGLIDLMSCIELGDQRSLMGIPGTHSWRPTWFSAMQKHGYTDYYFGLDADEAGQLAVEKMRTFAKSIDLNAHDEAPPVGKDWNDYLKSLHRPCER